MITTYVVYDESGRVQYCKRLSNAKFILRNTKDIYKGYILCLKGQYFGEGFHKYFLKYYKNGKYKRYSKLSTN